MASEQAKLTVGRPVEMLYQPVGAGFSGLMLAVIIGGVKSTLMPEIETCAAALPAWSVTTPDLIVWFAPSGTTIGAGQLPATPEPVSVQMNVTTGRPVAMLYQPVAEGFAGLILAVTVGGVVSILMVTGTEVNRPTPLVAEQVIVTPVVSAVWVKASHPVFETIPDCGSKTFQVTVTALTYQPFKPFVPLMMGIIEGGVKSKNADPWVPSGLTAV